MKTHVIDGKTFVAVERKAKVGEKVVGRLTGLYYDVLEVDLDGRIYHGQHGSVRMDNYRVLELQEPQMSNYQLLELIANLSRRVHSLERQVDSLSTQLRDTQNNVERQGVEIAEVEDDIRMLDERTQTKVMLRSMTELIERGLKERGVIR